MESLKFFITAILVTFSFNLLAQNFEIIQPGGFNNNISVGSPGANFKLKITAQGNSISGLKYKLFTGVTDGLYIIPSSTLPVGVTLDPLPSKRDFFSFEVSSLNPGQSIEIDFNLSAGNCLPLVVNQAIINSVFRLNAYNTTNSDYTDAQTLINNFDLTVNKAAYMVTSFDQNKVYYKSQVKTGSDMSVTGNTGETIIRHYVLNNTSGQIFNGHVKFQSNDPATTLLLVKNLSVYVYNTSSAYPGTLITSNTLSNSIESSISVQNNEKVIVIEEIEVTGCLDGNAGQGLKEISWGINQFENCTGSKAVLEPNVTRGPDGPNVIFSLTESNYKATPYCRSLTTGTPKNMVFENTGQAVAKNCNFIYYAYTHYFLLTPYSSFKVYIEHNGVRTPYDVNLDVNNLKNVNDPSATSVYWNDLPTWITSNSEYVTLLAPIFGPNSTNSLPIAYITNYLTANTQLQFNCIEEKDYLYNITTYTPNPIGSECLPNGGNTEIVRNLVLNTLIDGNGNNINIDLYPGDKFIIEWDEYYCGLNENFAWPDIYANRALFNYENECSVATPFASTPQTNALQSFMRLNPEPGASNLSADADRCIQTTDGQIENVSTKIDFYGSSFYIDQSVNNLDGKIIFKLYLDDGLDLDLSFEKPNALGFTGRGFNNLNNEVKCSSSCTDASGYTCTPTDNLTTPSYNIRLIKKDGTQINLSANVTRLGYHNDGGDQDKIDFYYHFFTDRQLIQGYYLYRIELDLSTPGLINVPAGMENKTNDYIRDLLMGSVISYDLRAYCPNDKRAVSSDPNSYGKLVIGYEKCDYQDPNHNDYTGAVNFTNLIPLSIQDLKFLVNCPGCRIPGTNIYNEHFTRVNRGLLDTDKDGFPDDGSTTISDNSPSIRYASNGDQMRASFLITMSDGEPKASGLGCTKTELDAAGYYLDNLYLRVNIPGGSGTVSYVDGSGKVKLGNGSWQTNKVTLVSQQGSQCLFRVKAEDIGSYISTAGGQVASFHVGGDYDVFFEADFIIDDYQLDLSLVDVFYMAGYSACDDCSTFTEISQNWQGTSGGTSNTSFDNVIATTDGLLWCTNGGLNFKFVPYRSEYRFDSYDFNYMTFDSDKCEKMIELRNWGEFGFGNNGYTNIYEDECRYFFDPNQAVKFETALPSGYVVDRIVLKNSASMSGYYITEQHTIHSSDFATYLEGPSRTGINSIKQGTLSNGMNGFSINLYYEHETEGDESHYTSQNSLWYRNITDNILPDRVFVKDEHWFTQVFLVLRKSENCVKDQTVAIPSNYAATNLPSVYSNTTPPNYIYYNNLNPSLLTAIGDNFDHQPSFGVHYGYSETDGSGNKINYFSPVNASLQISNNIDQTLWISGNKLYLGFNIKNLSDKDFANFPFLYLEGSALDPAKGLTLEGLYCNNYTSNNKYVGYPVKVSDGASGRKIILGFNRLEYLNAATAGYNSIPKMNASDPGYNFVLVFDYSCSSVPDQGCGTNTPPVTGLNGDNLTIHPGYNCYDYPEFADIDANDICGIFTPITYTISTRPIGTDINYSLNTSLGTVNNPVTVNVENCTSFTYELKLKSCQEGEIMGYDILLNNVPSGITLNENQISINNPIYVVAQDATNPLLYHLTISDPSNYVNNGEEPIVSFTWNINCAFNAGNLKLLVYPIASCGAILPSKELLTSLTASPVSNPVLDNIALTSISCKKGNYIEVNYSISSATTFNNKIIVSLPTGVTDLNGNNQITFNITSGTASGDYQEMVNMDPVVLCNLTDPVTATLEKYTLLDCPAIGESCEKLAATQIETCQNTPFAVSISSTGSCSGNAVISATVNPAGTYSYTWYKAGSLLSGITGNSITPSSGGVYHVVVSGPGCDAISNSITINQSPAAFITLSNGGVSFLCSGQSITLTAQPSGVNYSYSWSPGSSTAQQIDVSTADIYSVTVTDNTTGCYGTASANAIDHLEAICPDPVCPGENPPLTLTNTAGVIGSYFAGWYRADDPTMEVITSITEEGLYHAIAAPSLPGVPSCTLTTDGRPNWPCHITFKNAPVAYQLTTSGNPGICPNDPSDIRIISVSNPNANPALTDNDIVWNTSQLGTGDLTVTYPGRYYITATDPTTKCQTRSNDIHFYGPVIHINRECYEGNKVKLTASSSIPAGNYTWYVINQADGTETALPPASILNPPLNSIIILDQAGLYKVTNDVTDQCHTYRVLYETLDLTASPSLDVIPPGDGTFEGLDGACTTFGFDTPDFLCNDVQPDDTDNPDVILNYGDLPGHFMISNNTASPAGWWNRNYWTGSALSSDNFMIVDGQTLPAEQIIWKKTVNVNHGFKYLLRSNISNIDVATAFPPREIPEIEVRIIYKDANGNGIRHDLDKQILFNTDNGDNSDNWIELSGLTSADAKITLDNTTGEAVTADIYLVMKGGGAIGRDIGVDNISLIPVGLCDDPATIVGDRICNASFVDVDFSDLYTCKGVPVTFSVKDASLYPGLLYAWRAVSNGTSVDPVLETGSSFSVSNPTATATYDLTVTDPVNNCSFKRSVTVYVNDPTLQISSNAADACLMDPIEFTVTGFSGIGNIGYQWYLNNNPVSGAITSTWNASHLKNNDQVKCELLSGCQNAGGNALTVYSNVITVTGANVDAGSDATICQGGSVNLNASGGVSYSWSPADGLSNTSIADPVASPAATTTYTVSITDINGCIGEDQITVTVNLPPPAATIELYDASSTLVTELCAEENFTMVLTNPNLTSQPVLISRPPVTVIGGSGFPGGYAQYCEIGSTGGDFVVQNISSEGCVTESSLTLTVNPLPDNQITSWTGSMCDTETGEINYNTLPATVSFTFPAGIHQSGGTGGPGWGTIYLQPDGPVNGITPMWIQANMNNGTCTRTETIQITILPTPAVPVITASGTTTFCEGGDVRLSTPVISGIGGYQWNLNGSPIAGANGNILWVEASGDYSLTVSGYGGTCPVTSAVTTVTVNPLPPAGSLSVTPTTICENGTVSVGVGYPIGYTVGYTRPTGSTILGGGGGPGGFGESVRMTQTGDFVLTITSTEGCQVVTPVTVTVIPVPATPTITASGPTSFCDGGSVTLSTSVVSGASYQWNLNGTAISGATSDSYVADASGDYTVTTWFDNSCPVTSVVRTVTENSLPPTPAMTVSATNICQNGSVSVGVIYPASPNTYTYTRPAGYILLGGGGGPTGFGEGVRLTQSGDFILTYNTPQGCSSETRIHVNVTPVPATPTITASGATSFCDGGSVTLSTSVVSGASYQWNLNGSPISGATSDSYLADASGDYTVTTWFTSSCPVTSAVTTVTENPYPANRITTTGANICNNGDGSSSIYYTTGTGASVSFAFPPQLQPFYGTGGPGWAVTIFRTTASAVAGETYWVQGYTIAAGCTTSVSIPRTVIPTPAIPTVTALNNVICQGGNAHLTTSAVGTGYLWKRDLNWLSGYSAPSYLATVAGNYTVTVTASNGCTATSSPVAVSSSTNLAPRVTTNPDFTKCISSPATLRAGQIISFNGSNDYISFPASGFTIPAGNAITVEFWTYINTSDVSYRSAFQIGTQDIPNRCQAHVPWIDKKLYWDYGNATEGQGRISTDFTPYLDKQTHVALVANGSKRAIYLNGQLANSFTNGTDPGPDNALTGLVIGKFLNYYYRGHLDQFRIWNTERTQTQIQQGMYEEYPGGTANLIGSWRFDEYGGNTIVNDVNSSYNGTLQGSYHVRGFSPPAPATFTWSPISGLSSTNGNSVYTSTSTPMTYYIRGSLANGCAHTASVNVAVSACKEGVFDDVDTVSQQSEWSAELYPNPSQDATNLIIKNANAEKVEIEILDMKGVTVERHNEVNTKEPFVFGENLRSGIYLIKILDGDKFKILKFIKQE